MIATINNHVLFSQCDWRQLPEWSRTWQTEMSDAVNGKQSRRALCSVARHTLSFTVWTQNIIQQTQLDDAIRQAKKFGLACTPFWGRGCLLPAAQTGDTIQCRRGWDWTAGDYVWLKRDSLVEVTTVATANYNGGTGLWTLELNDTLTGSYSDIVRPLLFGKFNVSDMAARSPQFGPVRITISELTNSRSVQIGELSGAGPGIGAMGVGSTFVVA